KHEQAQQDAREIDLSTGSGTHEQHPVESHALSRLQGPALFIKSDRQDGSDDHEACQRREEDIVMPEVAKQPYQAQGQEKDASAVDKGWSGLLDKVTPPRAKPLQADAGRQMPLPALAPCLLDAG